MVVGHIREGRGGVSSGIVIQSLSQDLGELSTGGSAIRLILAVAHAVHITEAGRCHHIVIEPVAGLHVGESVGHLYVNSILSGGSLVLSNDSDLPSRGEVHVGDAGTEGLAQQFGIINGHNSALGIGGEFKVGDQVSVLGFTQIGAIGQSHGDGVVGDSGSSILKAGEPELAQSCAGVGLVNLQNKLEFLIGIAILIADSQLGIPHTSVASELTQLDIAVIVAIHPIVNIDIAFTADQQEGLALRHIVIVLVLGPLTGVVSHVVEHSVTLGNTRIRSGHTSSGNVPEVIRRSRITVGITIYIAAQHIGAVGVVKVIGQEDGVDAGVAKLIAGLDIQDAVLIQVAGEGVGNIVAAQRALVNIDGQVSFPAGAVHQGHVDQASAFLSRISTQSQLIDGVLACVGSINISSPICCSNVISRGAIHAEVITLDH